MDVYKLYKLYINCIYIHELYDKYFSKKKEVDTSKMIVFYFLTTLQT